MCILVDALGDINEKTIKFTFVQKIYAIFNCVKGNMI